MEERSAARRFMVRKIIAGVALASLVVLIPIWAFSYFQYVYVSIGFGERGAIVARSARGRLYFEHHSDWRDDTKLHFYVRPTDAPPPFRPRLPNVDYRVDLFGGEIDRGKAITWPANSSPGQGRWWTDDITIFEVHAGALAFIATLIAAWCLRHLPYLRFLYRQSEGLCPQCEYDLRATPHRCPECGWIRT